MDCNKKKTCIAIIAALSAKRRLKRKRWAKEWLLKRDVYTHLNFVREIRGTEDEDYENYYRMKDACFDSLLVMVKPFLTKQDTRMRKAISAEEKLAVTLRFLATGRNMKDLRFSAIMSTAAIGQAIMDTCEALFYSLQSHIQFLLSGVLLLLVTAAPGSAAPPECSSCESPNVRTVLFKTTDLVKECWSDDELALLYSRRLMQELLPKKLPCRIPILLDYFKLALETVRELTCSPQTHKLVVSAMADTFGGYIQAFAAPMTNAKYYEGTVSYCTARQLNELQLAFKRSLSTDGGGWTRPIFVKKSPYICSYKIPSALSIDVCPNLISSTEVKACNPASEGGYPGQQGTEAVRIPLPFLDDLITPRAIAVPFRDRSLYSLLSRNSSDILARYYTAGVRCLARAYDTPEQCGEKSPNVENFIASYHAWLLRAVVPHLHDETWYPGFGGIYRILEDMSQRGFVTPDDYEEIPSDEFALKLEETCECQSNSILFYIALVLGLLLLFWLLVCCLCCLIKWCGGGGYDSDYSCTTSSSSSGAVINTLVSMYCDKVEKDGDFGGHIGRATRSPSTPLLHKNRGKAPSDVRSQLSIPGSGQKESKSRPILQMLKNHKVRDIH